MILAQSNHQTTDRNHSRLESSSVGVDGAYLDIPDGASSSLSSKELIPFNGNKELHDLAKFSSGVPINNQRKYEHTAGFLLQSLPGFYGGFSAETDFLRPLKTSTVSTMKEEIERPSISLPPNWLKENRRKRAQKKRQMLTYSIEYSVFRPVPHMGCVDSESDMDRHLLEILESDCCIPEEGVWLGDNIDPQKFSESVNSIMHDVESDTALKPVRISQGSSGSYFIFGKKLSDASGNGGCAFDTYKKGVFKPKDEEPYGPLSPKWSKWLHRTFFPCFFGRSCLIPNLGYISEAAACVLDRQLMLFIVPYTDIIHLKSDQFYYSFWRRTRQKMGYKIGSFQCFLSGYVEANVFLKQNPLPHNLDNVPDDTFQLCHKDDTQVPAFFWSKALICQFQDELEKLVILDYIMRNTDRGTDNWMIKVDWIELDHDGVSKRMSAKVRIGAIDSGLAFPWKHPDEWRSFPFGWLFLPYYIIGRPFSNKTRRHYIPLLTSKFWWEQTTIKLKSCFQKDADFKERMWHKQIAVLKGQAFNVLEILKLQHAGPLELIRRENLLIWDDTMNVPSVVHNFSLDNGNDNGLNDSLGENIIQDRRKSIQHSETTPLLTLIEPTIDDEPQIDCEQTKKNHMSGFDYNMKLKGDCLCEGEEETNTKIVIIERLEKVHSSRPVFTWC